MSETATTENTKKSQQESALLFIHAQTPLHPGSGTALGTVDLPVQRERHTQWPLIPGSTLKGILRDACRPARNSEEWHKWLAVFGPETGDAADHAGAFSLTDARILAFPVRSLKGVFAWVTCSAVMERLHRDLQLADRANDFDISTRPDKDRGLCKSDSALLVDGNKLVLEEFEFERAGDADLAAAWVAEHAFNKDDGFTRERFKSHCVVLHDDDFTHFVRHATEVTARIKLRYESKTVEGRALFYQEFLPAETLFYSVALAVTSRRRFKKEDENEHRKTVDLSPQQVRAFVRAELNERKNVLQIGGDETIGKGLCAVRLNDGEEGAR